MGSGGASSGISKKGKKYGTEYSTLYESGNIKFVKYKDSANAKPPMETMTQNRVYVTIDNLNRPIYITYMSKENKRVKNIDLLHKHKGMIPHTHHGYYHNEKDNIRGASSLTLEERKMVEKCKSFMG